MTDSRIQRPASEPDELDEWFESPDDLPPLRAGKGPRDADAAAGACVSARRPPAVHRQHAMTKYVIPRARISRRFRATGNWNAATRASFAERDGDGRASEPRLRRRRWSHLDLRFLCDAVRSRLNHFFTLDRATTPATWSTSRGTRHLVSTREPSWKAG